MKNKVIMASLTIWLVFGLELTFANNYAQFASNYTQVQSLVTNWCYSCQELYVIPDLQLTIAEPDLVVTRLVITGPTTVNSENKVEVPISVTVKNQGLMTAGTFKVSTSYTGARGTFTVAFTVYGQNSLWYPWTTNPLPAGNEVTFSGKVTFHPSVHNETVSLAALADSCSGDEFVPSYCRVKESGESNNWSSSVSLYLP